MKQHTGTNAKLHRENILQNTYSSKILSHARALQTTSLCQYIAFIYTCSKVLALMYLLDREVKLIDLKLYKIKGKL